MTRTAQDSDRISTRQLLVARVRIIMLLSLLCGVVFAGLELCSLPDALPRPFYVKLVGITLISLTIVLLGRPWAVRHAWPLSIFIVSMGYILTALSGIVSPSREYATTAVLFVGGALATAVIVPWGLWPQCMTAAVGIVSLLIAIIRHDGNLQFLADDPGAAVIIVFALSLVTAYEVNRYRLAHRRELRERRRAERALRHLNLKLEQRVGERTADLEAANRQLAGEIVERQKASEALRDSQEQLRRHQDELAHVLRVHTIGEMAAALAHEIHQPLGAITNYARGGAHRLQSDTADPAQLLWAFEQIAKEGLRAGQILRGIRNLVKREHEPAAAIDVNALTAEAVRVIEPQARQHDVTVHLEAADHLPLVQGDAAQIEQVILNLLLNGVEAIADGIHARRDVNVTTISTNANVEVAVCDTGGGIAASIADKLFTPFFSTKPRGLGLGLAISRSIITSHGGRLWATPNPGSGTTFRFSLPLLAADDLLRDVGT